MKKLEIFKASWCKACPTSEEIERLKGKFDITIFNLDNQEHMRYANSLNVKSLPTFIVDSTDRYFILSDLPVETKKIENA